MCKGCWECEDEFPAAWTPPIARAVVLWRRLYDDLRQPTGGPLHVELDDCNLDYDEIVPSYSRRGYGGRPDTEDGYPPEVHEVCDELAALLTAMTLTERYTVMAYADGYHDVPEPFEVAAEDVQEKPLRAPGGTLIRLTHQPTGVTVVGCDGREEEDTRAQAWRMLRNRLAAEAMSAGVAG